MVSCSLNHNSSLEKRRRQESKGSPFLLTVCSYLHERNRHRLSDNSCIITCSAQWMTPSPFLYRWKLVSEYPNSSAIFKRRPAKQFLGEVHAGAHHSTFHDQMIKTRLTSNNKVNVPAAIINSNRSLVWVIFITYISSIIKTFTVQQSFRRLQFHNKTTSVSWWRGCIVWARWLQTWIRWRMRYSALAIRTNRNGNFDGAYLTFGLTEVLMPSPVHSLAFLPAIPCCHAARTTFQLAPTSKAKSTVHWQGFRL